MKSLLIIILLFIGCSNSNIDIPVARANEAGIVYIDSLYNCIAKQEGFIVAIKGILTNGKVDYSDSLAISLGYEDTTLQFWFKTGVAEAQILFLTECFKEVYREVGYDEINTFDSSF